MDKLTLWEPASDGWRMAASLPTLCLDENGRLGRHRQTPHPLSSFMLRPTALVSTALAEIRPARISFPLCENAGPPSETLTDPPPAHEPDQRF